MALSLEIAPEWKLQSKLSIFGFHGNAVFTVSQSIVFTRSLWYCEWFTELVHTSHQARWMPFSVHITDVSVSCYKRDREICVKWQKPYSSLLWHSLKSTGFFSNISSSKMSACNVQVIEATVCSDVMSCKMVCKREYRITPHTTRTFIHCSTYVKEGVRVINGYINQNIFTSMLWTCGAWWKILWWVPIVYWPVTMTKLWWLPFWYPGCPRWCLKIDFSRTVNWYHLHSDSEHYKHCTI